MKESNQEANTGMTDLELKLYLEEVLMKIKQGTSTKNEGKAAHLISTDIIKMSVNHMEYNRMMRIPNKINFFTSEF